MNGKSLDMDENVTALLAYLLGWVSGLVVYLLEKENRYVRFHAMQSILTFGAITLLGILLGAIPLLNSFLLPILNLLAIVLWIVLMVKAWQHETVRLPVVAGFADEMMKKI